MAKNVRQAKRAARQQRRVSQAETRQKRKQSVYEAKQRKKEQKQLARQSVKGAKKLEKIYGKMSPEEVNAINEITPLVGAMNKQLIDKGIIPNDETDPIEVSNLYANQNEDIPSIMEDEDLSELYFERYVEFFETSYFPGNVFGDKLKQIAKGATTFISGGLTATLQQAKDAQRTGQPLTPGQQQVLELDKISKQAQGSVIKKEGKNYLGWILAITLSLLLLGKKIG